MNYAIDHERFDPFNFNRYVADIVAELPSGLVKVLAFLGGHISYSSEHEMFPKGTVSGLSAPKIADRIGMGRSTVQGHLSEAKRRNIIATKTLTDRNGRTIGVRYFFPGFSKWLCEGRFMSRHKDEPSPQEAGVGGSESSDPNNIKDSSNNIIHDDLLNLEFEGSIAYTEVEDAIREAKPLVNGQAADPNKVWSDFCSFNRKKGKRWLPLKWLIGFCRVYGRRKFVQPADAAPEANAIEEKVAETIETPDFKADHPFDQMAKLVFERSPAVWKNWIKPLTARRDGNVWIVETPSSFHKNYVVNQFAETFERCFGPDGVRFE